MLDKISILYVDLILGGVFALWVVIITMKVFSKVKVHKSKNDLMNEVYAPEEVEKLKHDISPKDMR